MREIGIILIVFLIFTMSINSMGPHQISHVPSFSGTNAYQHLIDQCNFGPRPPGSENLSMCRTMISDTFRTAGWNVTFQNFTYQEVECVNIIATWASSEASPLILGAHYDTRPRATSDPDPVNRSKPIIGANDGASGVAVLMELARSLPESVRSAVELVLFDAEDSGQIDEWDWIQGATYYVSQLSSERKSSIRAMVLADMVGDESLRLPRESSSTRSLQNTIWNIANQLGYNETFLENYGASITDDHRPFLNAGIPAVDLIHYPFPWYWHTLEDTPDKCSSTSLQIVGDVLEVFVVEQANDGSTFPIDESMPLIIALGVAAIIATSFVYFILKRR